MFPLSSRSRTQQSFRYQSLEQRCLLAGNVTVVEEGHLYIRGDQTDNEFEVVVDSDQLRVNGLGGTTINGQSHYVVQGTKVTEFGVTFDGGLRAHLGPGHDQLMVNDAVFESFSIIYGGTGDDAIDIRDSRFADKLTIQTYDGHDDVSTTDSQFAGDFYAITLDGQDSVSNIDTIFEGVSIVATGNHADTLTSSGNRYMGDVNLLLGQNGGDEVELNHPVVGVHQLGVFAGNHDDSIRGDLTQASVQGSIRISGQAGFDDAPEIPMNDGTLANTVITSIEKGELVFESDLGGIENVANEATTERWTFFSEGFDPEPQIEQYATPVTLESTQDIRLIEWSGSYLRDYFISGLDVIADDFIVEIFEDAGDGAPDVASVTQFSLGEAVRVESGNYENELYGEVPVYSYHAEIDFTMEAGKTYWVSIFNELDQSDLIEQNRWGWGYGVDAQAESTLFNQGYIDVNENDWRFGENPYAIHGVEMDLRLRG